MPTRKATTVINKAPVARKKRVRKKKTAPINCASRNTSTRPAPSKQTTIQTLTLEAVVVINNAKSLYQELNQLTRNSNVNIDASAVEMIDTAVLQLLYAFVMQAQSSSHTVNWTNPSKEFVSRAKLLGLTRHMGIA